MKIKNNSETLAKQLHKSFQTINLVEIKIEELFIEYEPEIYYNEGFYFHIDSDDYDNSLEVYFEMILPYPYEPCTEIREELRKLGFSIIYFNFIDENGDYTEEIRGSEPRRYKNFDHICFEGLGYVDDRFNKDEWMKMRGIKNED